MVPRLVPEISSLDAFCDGGAAAAGAAAAGIGDSRSWIHHHNITSSYVQFFGGKFYKCVDEHNERLSVDIVGDR